MMSPVTTAKNGTRPSPLEPGYRGEAPFLRPPNTEEFQCREVLIRQPTNNIAVDNGGGESSSSSDHTLIAFECTVSPLTRLVDKELGDDRSITRIPSHFVFACREASYGVLTQEEQQQQPDSSIREFPTILQHKEVDDQEDPGPHEAQEEEEDDDDGVDSSGFFLLSAETYPYALAGKTGFQIWPGARILVDVLTFPRHSDDSTALHYWQQRMFRQQLQPGVDSNTTASSPPCHVLELGAGVGVVGTCLAACGAEVLMTDLPTVVTKSLIPNLRRNAVRYNSNNDTRQQSPAPPNWLQQTENDAKCRHEAIFSIGHAGWVATAALDWTKPLHQQLSTCQYQTLDLIIASDCVWLASMLDGVLSTVQTIFDAAAAANSNTPKLLLSFQRRDSEMFTNVDRVLHEIQQVRGWHVSCLAWYPVSNLENSDNENHVQYSNQTVDPSDGAGKLADNEVFLFEVSPIHPNGAMRC